MLELAKPKLFMYWWFEGLMICLNGFAASYYDLDEERIFTLSVLYLFNLLPFFPFDTPSLGLQLSLPSPFLDFEKLCEFLSVYIA